MMHVDILFCWILNIFLLMFEQLIPDLQMESESYAEDCSLRSQWENQFDATETISSKVCPLKEREK